MTHPSSHFSPLHSVYCAAQRRGFSNPAQAAEIAGKGWGLLSHPTAEQADSMVRALVAERPDLLKPDWANAWSPAELAEVRDQLLTSARQDQNKREALASFVGQHGGALAVADQVRSQQRRALADQRDMISRGLFTVEQQLGPVRERRRAVEVRINAMVKEVGPFPSAHQKEQGLKAVEVLEAVMTEEATLVQAAERARAELNALPKE